MSGTVVDLYQWDGGGALFKEAGGISSEREGGRSVTRKAEIPGS